MWLVDPSIPNPKGHYAVWLLPLYEQFGNHSEWEVHWICTAAGIKKTKNFISHHQYFHVLPKRSLTIGLYTAYIRERLSIQKVIRDIQPDILHTWGTEYFYGLCGKDYKGKIWLHSVQGLLKAYMKRGKMSRFHKIHSIYEPGVLKAAKYLTTESEWAADCVRETVKNAQPLIWDYAVEDRFFSTERQIAESPTCLYCGSSAEIKNLDTLIEAFSVPELSHINLILAGPAPKEDYPPNITALGRQSRDTVADLLSKTWCLIHPSKADTGPTALKEARVMGVPVIATHSCGAKRYIDEGKSGFIVNPTDVQAYINAVLKITKNKETAISFGEHGRAEVRTKLTKDTMYNGLVDIYTTLLQKEIDN